MTFNPDVDIPRVRAALAWMGAALDITLLVVITVVVVRGCRRAGLITFDAALFAGYTLSAWQDPLYDYSGPFALHSQYALHLPSWGPYIPGWQGHSDSHLNIETAIGLAGVGGFAAMIACVWTQWWLIDQVARRRPRWRRARMLPLGLLAGLVTVCFFEALAISTGAYAWAGAVRSLSLWGGHWYQYPLYECFAWTVFLTVAAMTRHNWRAHATIPHMFRGTEPAVSRGDNWTRLLAGVGFANVATLGYMAVNATATLFANPAPADTPDFLWPR
ncbi:spirocyclase AveC family protein [Streptomyces sp. cg36]|uniref:spirocyclase AveC family protein n=1 Tax=Streptomyces sp. cg36 TaxID=3238798 RepID=UPI0034E1D291